MPFLKAGSHTLHYADSHPTGPPTPTGLTFIFIHGLGSSQNYYFPVIPHLTGIHRCITIDTYGSARSPYTHDSVSIPSIAEDVIGALDALNVPKAVVVGHSMGGLVVTELGARYPDRVSGVVAIGPTHPSETLVSVMNKRAETVLECEYLLHHIDHFGAINAKPPQLEWNQWPIPSLPPPSAPAARHCKRHSFGNYCLARIRRGMRLSVALLLLPSRRTMLLCGHLSCSSLDRRISRRLWRGAGISLSMFRVLRSRWRCWRVLGIGIVLRRRMRLVG